MKLEIGKFYVSKDQNVWCCFRISENVREPQAAAWCIRVDDCRVEYFYLDGRYDSKSEREHTLVMEKRLFNLLI